MIISLELFGKVREDKQYRTGNQSLVAVVEGLLDDIDTGALTPALADVDTIITGYEQEVSDAIETAVERSDYDIAVEKHWEWAKKWMNGMEDNLDSFRDAFEQAYRRRDWKVLSDDADAAPTVDVPIVATDQSRPMPDHHMNAIRQDRMPVLISTNAFVDWGAMDIGDDSDGLAPGTCPVCNKTFEGERGVRSHRAQVH